jgi:hypothetical protein
MAPSSKNSTAGIAPLSMGNTHERSTYYEGHETCYAPMAEKSAEDIVCNTCISTRYLRNRIATTTTLN